MQHLAIIMDGNGRWAKARHLPRIAGHKKGANIAQDVIKLCIENEIKYLTLYSFSAENWQRPKEEVTGLMDLFRYYLNNEIAKMHKNNIRLRFIGDRDLLDDDIVQKMTETEELTANNDALNLNIAMSYGSRQEITNAMRQIANDLVDGKISADDVNEDLITRNLYTHDIPDPDMLIRTGGEKRISNYLLWQCAYTELYFTDILWPAFDEMEFNKALEDFSNRERRFGKI